MARQNLNGLQPGFVPSLGFAGNFDGAIFLRYADYTLWESDSTNWFYIPWKVGPKTDTVAASAAINTTETYITTALVIAANQLKVGDHFRIRVYGTCTSSVANISTFTVRFGANGTIADAALATLTCTGVTSGASVPFGLEFDVIIRSIGSSGSAIVCGRLSNNGTTGVSSAVSVVSVGSVVTVNTTAIMKLGLSYKSAGTTTTTTFQSACIEQVN